MQTKVLYGLTGALAMGAVVPAQAQKKPMNIVFIMSDDHSYQTISAYDKRFISTPNIDWLADNGVKFTKRVSSQTRLVALHVLVCSLVNTAMLMASQTTPRPLMVVSRPSQSYFKSRATRLL